MDRSKTSSIRPRLSELRVLFVAVGIALPLGACEECEEQFGAPAVLLLDDRTGGYVCDASVSVRSGSSVVDINAESDTGVCVYLLPPRTGSFELEIVASGYTSVNASVHILPSNCPTNEQLHSDAGPVEENVLTLTLRRE